MLFIPQNLVSQSGKVVEKEFLFFHVSTAQPAMCSTLRRQPKKKAGNHQSSRCVQISETFCSSLAALFSTSLIFSSLSIHLLSNLQPAAKRAADNSRFPRFCFVKPSCRFPFPHILMSDTSCLGPWSSFTVLSSLIRHHPPSYSYFYPSVSPTSYVLHCISPFHLLM